MLIIYFDKGISSGSYQCIIASLICNCDIKEHACAMRLRRPLSWWQFRLRFINISAAPDARRACFITRACFIFIAKLRNEISFKHELFNILFVK